MLSTHIQGSLYIVLPTLLPVFIFVSAHCVELCQITTGLSVNTHYEGMGPTSAVCFIVLYKIIHTASCVYLCECTLCGDLKSNNKALRHHTLCRHGADLCSIVLYKINHSAHCVYFCKCTLCGVTTGLSVTTH